jgi:hypothetical protein
MGRPIASAFVATFERVPFRRLTLVGRRLTTPPLATGDRWVLGGAPAARMGEAHKFTRANDFRHLSALFRNFFAATSSPPRSGAARTETGSRAVAFRASTKPKAHESAGIISPSETKRFVEQVVSRWNPYER